MKKILLIFAGSGYGRKIPEKQEGYDEVKVERIEIGENMPLHGFPWSDDENAKKAIINTVTNIAEKIGEFYNWCNENNCKGYVSLSKLPAVIACWTYMSLQGEEEINFVGVKDDSFPKDSYQN